MFSSGFISIVISGGDSYQQQLIVGKNISIIFLKNQSRIEVIEYPNNDTQSNTLFNGGAREVVIVDGVPQ